MDEAAREKAKKAREARAVTEAAGEASQERRGAGSSK
jgi:hypothetical protein